ncbi:8502_t:CDS:2, partial [Cetraspora pellucida]
IHVANIVPNCEGTIYKISNWHKWTWPDEGAEAGYILARSLPGLGL